MGAIWWQRLAFAGALLGCQAAAQTAGIATVSGVDAGSGIAFALISADGKTAGGGADAGDRPPRLTAQCTRDTKGKLRFELLADAGNVPELRFVAPWKQTQESLFPPVMPKAVTTMEFLGYMKVKPVKRVWTGIDGLQDEWKYATPGISSGNMEEIMFYLQYLKALPTLRLMFPAGTMGKAAVTLEFETANWQVAVKAEPLCWASGL